MIDHPLTEAHVRKLWERCRNEDMDGWLWLDEKHREALVGMVRDAYDSGREDALATLDPLTTLTPGTILRDVTIMGHGSVGDAFISTDADGPCVATARHWCSLGDLVEFTTDDLTTRYTYYTHHGGIWTAETLKEDDA